MTRASAITPADSRLAVIAEADRWSPSTRYRAIQHLAGLQARFAAVELSLPNDPVGRAPGRRAQLEYFGTHAARYAQRGLSLPGLLRRSDALLIQRALYVLGPALVTRPLGRFSGPVVYDLDDAVFTPDPALAEKGKLAQWLYGGRQSQYLLRRADAIVVSTERLAEMLPSGIAPVTIVPTVPDPAAHGLAVHDGSRPVVIGWVGTVGGVGFLDPLRDVFARLRAEGLATLEVVSSAPWDGPADFHAWTLREETSLFQRFGIGIMPLPRSDYTRAKAGFKLLQYMASGLPVICSPVGVNAELIERSGAGFTAEGPAEWEAALRRLVSDPALRAELGAKGRAFVESYGDLDGQAATLTRLLSGG